MKKETEMQEINKQIKTLQETKRKITDRTANEIKQYLEEIEKLDEKQYSLFLVRLELRSNSFEARFERLKLEAFTALEEDLEDLKEIYNNLKQQKEENEKSN